MNSVKCKRSSNNSYEGDCSYPTVVKGNTMAQSTVLLVLLAVSKEVRAACENLLGNHFCHYPPMKELMLAL